MRSPFRTTTCKQKVVFVLRTQAPHYCFQNDPRGPKQAKKQKQKTILAAFNTVQRSVPVPYRDSPPPSFHPFTQPTSFSAPDISPANGEYISSDAEVTDDATENAPLWWVELVADAGETPKTYLPEEVADAGETGGSESGYTGCCCGATPPLPPPPPPPPQAPIPSAPR